MELNISFFYNLESKINLQQASGSPIGSQAKWQAKFFLSLSGIKSRRDVQKNS